MAKLLTTSERRFAEAVVSLTYCSPLLPARIAHGRAALGDGFDVSEADWNLHGNAVRWRIPLGRPEYTSLVNASNVSGSPHERRIISAHFRDRYRGFR